jgi:hypothetical protein
MGELQMANVKTGIIVSAKESASVISDSGRVRIGDMSPSFPAVREKPSHVSDSRRVRIGDMSPSFPPLRKR